MVLRVYLDQAKWIDLARAMHGRPDGEGFRDALDVARHSVALGVAQFPLSFAHYIETWRAGNEQRRRRLAEMMIELSRAAVMTRPPELCDNELDTMIAALHRVSPRRARPVFGSGFAYLDGQLIHPPLPDALSLAAEREWLATRPDGFASYGRGHRTFGDVYSAGEQGLVRGQADDRATHEAVIALSAVMEIYENIEWALQRAGLGQDALGPIGRVRPDLPRHLVGRVLNDAMPIADSFIAGLPTRDAALRLRLMRHQNPAVRWESNDLNDIAYLACAVVHCDILVTERQWVHELRRSGLLDQHGTQALDDVSELPAVLVAATSSS